MFSIKAALRATISLLMSSRFIKNITFICSKIRRIIMDNSKYIDVNGISTHYHESGQGEAVLLIHGSGPGVTAWANWRLIFQELSENFHVFAPDIVGFGYTERPENVERSEERRV